MRANDRDIDHLHANGIDPFFEAIGRESGVETEDFHLAVVFRLVISRERESGRVDGHPTKAFQNRRGAIPDCSGAQHDRFSQQTG
jgi:hypothetical protein